MQSTFVHFYCGLRVATVATYLHEKTHYPILG